MNSPIGKTRRVAMVVASLALGATTLGACASSSDDGDAPSYPTKTITLTIPYAPGGGTDTAGRLLAKALEDELDTSVVVVNKEGGGGAIGVGEVAKSKADGYTLGVATDSNIVLQPILNKDLTYGPDDVVTWGVAPSKFVVVAAADSPYQSLSDIIAEAKKRPGKIRIAHPGTGGSNDLTAQAFALAAGIDIVPVPITGGGAEINKAVASGQVELAMTTVPVAQGFVDAKKLVIAGTMGEDPAVGAEKSETLGSIGVSTDLIPNAQLVMLAPAGLPDHVEKALDRALKDATSGEFGTKMGQIGFPVGYEDSAQSKTAMKQVQQQYEQILSQFKARS